MVATTAMPTQGHIIILEINKCLVFVLTVQRHAKAFYPEAVLVRSVALKEVLGPDDRISVAVAGPVVVTSPHIAAPAAALACCKHPPLLPSRPPMIVVVISPNSVMRLTL